MAPPRTFSFAGPLAAVSWRVAHVALLRVGLDVAVIADGSPPPGKIVAVLTVRAADPGTRAHVALDDRHLATFRLVRPVRFLEGLPDDLFRHAFEVPASAADGRTHVLTVVLNLDARPDGAPAMAWMKAAFYARSSSTRARPPVDVDVTKRSRSAPGS